MKHDQLMSFIHALRKTKKKLVTNYYLTYQNSQQDFETWIGENSVVFCVQEENLVRCFFASTDMEELNHLLANVPEGAVMDYISREEMRQFPWVDSGIFEHYTTLMRHTNSNFSEESPKSKRSLFLEQFYDESIGEFARQEDAEELYDMLYKIFDYRVSRLPSRQQLSDMIDKNWVLLYRENDRIVAFLMYQIEGRKYYGYQIYNEGTADITYNLEVKANKYARDHYPVNSSYAWIEVGNKAANDRVGASFDGTYDYIFIRGKGGI